VVDVLNRIERALEEAVEGTSRRLFRSRLQPVMLAKAASRAMQQEQVIGPDGPEVPNQYQVLLHPSDFQQFAPYRQSLQTRIERYLAEFAADRGLRPVAEWAVQLASDGRVRPRSVVVHARMADVPQDGAKGRRPIAEGTELIDEAEVASGTLSAELETEDGQRHAVDGTIMKLGRALENDVVIPDSRVSRFHAEIRRDGGRLVVYDLDSTNGTFVGGRSVQKHTLKDGDEISLGGYLAHIRVHKD
jgi:hypothetical protein